MSSKKAMTCPCCKVEMSVREDGWGQCPTRNCDFVGLVAPELMSMWGNQRTPGTVEVPVEKLEALRDYLPTMFCSEATHEAGCRACQPKFFEITDSILSVLPEREVDHVAMLRVLLNDFGKRYPEPPVPQIRSALEFAIKKLEEE